MTQTTASRTHSRELRIDDLKIEDLYEVYWKNLYKVNRRYQRKLVWSFDEKVHFIDSMRNGFPVPLLLLARVQLVDGEEFEILDGLQRMNAIVCAHFVPFGEMSGCVNTRML